jgi:hypothetical protein
MNAFFFRFVVHLRDIIVKRFLNGSLCSSVSTSGNTSGNTSGHTSRSGSFNRSLDGVIGVDVIARPGY